MRATAAASGLGSANPALTRKPRPETPLSLEPIRDDRNGGCQPRQPRRRSDTFAQDSQVSRRGTENASPRRVEPLAVLTPRPLVNLFLYYGVLAPRAVWRAALVPAASHAIARSEGLSVEADDEANHAAASRAAYQWAESDRDVDRSATARCLSMGPGSSIPSP